MPQLTAEISLHQAKVSTVFDRNPVQSFTNGEIAKRTGVAPRTVRHHTRNFLELGLIKNVGLYPPQFRLANPDEIDPSGRAYLLRLRQAAKDFGV